MYRSALKVARDEQCVANREANLALCTTLHKRLGEALGQGPQKAVDKHLQQGMMLARDRVELLLDDDSPFLELCTLAGYGMDGA